MIITLLCTYYSTYPDYMGMAGVLLYPSPAVPKHEDGEHPQILKHTAMVVLASLSCEDLRASLAL